jgi:hypothetical protein
MTLRPKQVTSRDPLLSARCRQYCGCENEVPSMRVGMQRVFYKPGLCLICSLDVMQIGSWSLREVILPHTGPSDRPKRRPFKGR